MLSDVVEPNQTLPLVLFMHKRCKGKLLAIHFRIIFRIKTRHNTHGAAHNPYISPNRTRLIFLPVARYAMDPIFNIVLTNLPIHNPFDTFNLGTSDRPGSPTTNTGYNVTRDRDVKISPNSRRGKRDQHHANATFASLPVTAPKVSLSPHCNLHLCVLFTSLFVSCIWTFLLSRVQPFPIMLINPSYIFHTQPSLSSSTPWFRLGAPASAVSEEGRNRT